MAKGLLPEALQPAGQGCQTNGPGYACPSTGPGDGRALVRPLKFGPGLEDGYHRLSSSPIPHPSMRGPGAEHLDGGWGWRPSEQKPNSTLWAGHFYPKRKWLQTHARGRATATPCNQLAGLPCPTCQFEFTTRRKSGHSELPPSLSSRARRIVQHQASASCLNGMSHPSQR